MRRKAGRTTFRGSFDPSQSGAAEGGFGAGSPAASCIATSACSNPFLQTIEAWKMKSYLLMLRGLAPASVVGCVDDEPPLPHPAVNTTARIAVAASAAFRPRF